MLNALRAAWRFISRCSPADEDVARELRFHVDRQTELLVSRGVPPADAARQARAAFGSTDAAVEGCRDARRLSSLSGLIRDLRQAGRALWRARGLTCLAVLCLGFGIGLDTAMFAVVDGVLLQPYPYPDADRLVVIGVTSDAASSSQPTPLSYPDFEDWRARADGTATIEAAAPRQVALSGIGDPVSVSAAAVSPGLFALVGAAPIAGRAFMTSDGIPGAPDVVVLSHDLWTRRYGADRTVVGRSVLIDGRPHVVIGVMPAGFAFPNQQALWTPLGVGRGLDARGVRTLTTIARLAPGITRGHAAQTLDAVAADLARTYPATNADLTRASVRTLHEAFVPAPIPVVLWLMFAGATLVLFIACSNVANLLLARATARSHELAVRAALGASRVQIVRHLLAESLLLGVVAIPLAATIAALGTWQLARMMPAGAVPAYVHWQMDGRALLYASVMALAATVAAGLAPAIGAARGRLSARLTERSTGTGRSVLRSALVAAQVAVSLVAVVLAALFSRTFDALAAHDWGVDATHVLMLRVAMTGDRYADTDARVRRMDDILRRAVMSPGVESAAVSTYVPLAGGGERGRLDVEGRTVAPDAHESMRLVGATSTIFETLGVHLVRGRLLTPAESLSRANIAVVNEGLAARAWPGRDPIGRRFRVWTPSTGDQTFTVVGVAADFGAEPGEPHAEPTAFVPYAWQAAPDTALVLRVAGDPASAAPLARAAIGASDPQLPIADVQTMPAIEARAFWQFALFGRVFGAIGIAALLLAACGVYGLVSYAVSLQTQEMGVRIALGADRRRIVATVVGRGLRLAAVGIAAGLIVAPALTWLARGTLVGVGPFDPPSFAAAALLLAAMACAASLVPAWRASRVDAASVLRGALR
jgi:predicted permease